MQASLRFLYLYTHDLEQARRFYSDLIGLNEFYYQAGESVAYRCDALQFSIEQHPEARSVPPEGWALQPGWVGGSAPLISWSVECDPAAFRQAVQRLQAAGVSTLTPEPQWVGYWSFVVRDPMGNTVELSDPESPADTLQK